MGETFIPNRSFKPLVNSSSRFLLSNPLLGVTYRTNMAAIYSLINQSVHSNRYSNVLEKMMMMQSFF
jgi:hypothetical protein